MMLVTPAVTVAELVVAKHFGVRGSVPVKVRVQAVMPPVPIVIFPIWLLDPVAAEGDVPVVERRVEEFGHGGHVTAYRRALSRPLGWRP